MYGNVFACAANVLPLQLRPMRLSSTLALSAFSWKRLLARSASHSIRRVVVGLASSAVYSSRHYRGGEARHGSLSVRLRPEVALLLQLEAARLEKLGDPLPRRRGGVDTAEPWLAGRIDHGSRVAHKERSRVDEFGREVVERDDTAGGGSGDLAQSALD